MTYGSESECATHYTIIFCTGLHFNGLTEIVIKKLFTYLLTYLFVYNNNNDNNNNNNNSNNNNNNGAVIHDTSCY